MILSPLKRLALLAGFLVILYLLFPSNTEMVLLATESGNPLLGQTFLANALRKNPRDFDLRLLSAAENWEKDRVSAALADAKVALEEKAKNLRALQLNATYQEWAEHKQEAYATFSMLAALDPKQSDLHLKLAAMAMDLQKPREAIAHAVEWVRTRPPLPANLEGIPFFPACRQELTRLSDAVLASQASDLGRDALYHLCGLYAHALEDAQNSSHDFAAATDALMRTCALSGLLDDAVATALDLDRNASDAAACQGFIRILASEGMADRIGPALTAMVHLAPPKEAALLALRALAGMYGLADAETSALQRLTGLTGLTERYLPQLLAQDVMTEHYDTLKAHLKTYGWFNGRGEAFLRQVAAAALVSGDKALMETVVGKMDSHGLHDADLLAVRNRLAETARTGQTATGAVAANDRVLAMGLTDEAVPRLREEAATALSQGLPDAAYARLRLCLLASHDLKDFETLVTAAHATVNPTASLRAADALGDRLLEHTPAYLRIAVALRLEINAVDAAYAAQRALVALVPDTVEINRLRELAGETGDAAKEREALGIARTIRPEDDTLLRQAVAQAIADSDLKRAEALLRERLAKVPGDADALHQLATVADWTNQQSLALESLRRLQALGKATTEDRIRLAQDQEASGDGRGALRTVLALLEAAPQNDALLRLGYQYAQWYDQPATAARLGERLSRLPGGQAFYRGTAEAWLAVSEPGRAAGWLEKAVAAGQNDAPTLHLLFDTYSGLGRTGPMLDVAKVLAAKDALSTDETVAVAGALLDRGQVKEALGRLEPLATSRSLPKDGQLLYLQALARSGRRAEAIARIKAVSSQYGNDAAALAIAADSASLAGQPQLAVELYRKVLALTPKNAAAVRALASLLSDTGERHEAAALINDYHRTNTGDADSHTLAADLSASQGNEAKARKEYLKALRQLSHPSKEGN